MVTLRDSCIIFDNLSTEFTNLLYSRTEDDSKLINKTLDELNSLNYKHIIVTNSTKAILLVNQCCTLVHPDDTILVSKCCQLISKLVTYQGLQIAGKTLKMTVDWCMQALKQTDSGAIVNVLITTNALLRINPFNTQGLLRDIVINNSPVVLLAQDISREELSVLATECLEACTIPIDESKKKLDITSELNICTKIFMNYFTSDKYFADIFHHKMLVSCLRGILNIATQDVGFLNNHLEILLGIVRSYMLYGVKGIDFIKPQKLLPSQLSIPESSVNTLREKKGGKVPKLVKTKTVKMENKRTESNFERRLEENRKVYVPASRDLDTWSNPKTNSNASSARTSDSEVSDNETVTTARLTYFERKVRQAALNLFLKVIKCTEKRIIFSYWSSFIPDGSPSGKHSICTCILKDPAPTTRMIALNVLLSLLSSSKLYLSQAESSEKSTSFTPFSVTLGSMILEMHRCLRFALNENSMHVLTQVLKCFAELVQASPYHRLSAGTITKVVRSIKVFLGHKDTIVQVRALIVFGCILASEPPIPETKTILLKCSSDKDKLLEYTSGSASESKVSNEYIEYANFSSDEDENAKQEPVPNVADIPWILRICLRNLGVVINSAGDCVVSNYSVPLPVKLESLQILAVMTRNYFTSLISPYLLHIAKGLEIVLSFESEKYTDLRLRAGSTLDSIGQAMSLYFVNDPYANFLSVEQGLAFWNSILIGPLLKLIQNEEHPGLRAVACDCLGSIGANIFERLTKDKQMLVIMSLLHCSRDKKSNVKGAAVRALAISVLYPSLREDSGFVIDTAETIYRTFHDSNGPVKIKASWSLANLTNALVLNKDNPNIIEEVPLSLLINLMKISIKGCSDNDSVKMNTVRALGNLLQLLSEEQMKNEEFRKHCMNGIRALITHSSTGSNMKVRWNACYSLGKVLRNDAIYIETNCWQKSMFDNLINLVIGFKNFKVRINAALALSSITKRSNYGEYYLPTWRALLKALENSENMEDFTEYKHRDNLVDQVCLSIGHLTAFLVPADLHVLQDDIVFYCDLLKCNIQKVYERVIPEKASSLTAAEVHLKSLLLLKDLSNEQKEILNSLNEIFNNDITL